MITLSRVDCFDCLPKIFGRIRITPEVFQEVSIAGAGLPGAAQVGIDVVSVRDRAGTKGEALRAARRVIAPWLHWNPGGFV